MLKPVRIAALFVLVPAVYLSGACADIPTQPPDAVGIVAEPVIAGPCLTACALARTGACDWEEQCSDDYAGSGMGGREALCGQKFLSCDAAEHASYADAAWALSYCWRSCEHLN